MTVADLQAPASSLIEEKNLHVAAREMALTLVDPDKKQLKYNEIVRAAMEFYNNPLVGVYELVISCDRVEKLYIKNEPMWKTLQERYRWMVKDA